MRPVRKGLLRGPARRPRPARPAGWPSGPLQHDCRPDEVVKEIGSGLNGNRRQLRRIIGDPSVGTIIVEHRERLCRFGFEYIEAALSARGARILVVDDGEVWMTVKSRTIWSGTRPR